MYVQCITSVPESQIFSVALYDQMPHVHHVHTVPYLLIMLIAWLSSINNKVVFILGWSYSWGDLKVGFHSIICCPVYYNGALSI